MLTVENISKSFGGVVAVRDCSFTIPQGEITALIGPNGAGKTTLFNIVNGFIAQDRGSITFAGNDVSKRPTWERSRLGMSRTFQLSRLFRNLSIRSNLELAIRQDDDRFWKMFFGGGKPGEFDARIAETLQFVGLEKDAETPVTDLSYGQQKLFDLARALLNPHSLLLLDEPVAGVNPVIRGRLKDILLHLRQKGETILLVEHDMDFVRAVADSVIVMDQGSVLVKGRPDIVLSDPKVLEAYLGK